MIIETAALSPNGRYEDPLPTGNGFQKAWGAYTSGGRQ
ncbi:Hypothetical protein BSSP1_II1155 [Brucella suis bv. 2]|nr:Hypothetical protein BSSP1_II1155 [Brucella suis bv. 2]